MEHCQYNMSEMIPVMNRIFAKGGTFSFYPAGTSMQPFIVQGRDKVILSSVPDRLKKYDIVLYQRENGTYVLHRIVGLNGNIYTMRGDNQDYLEPGICVEQILAVVTSVERNGKIWKMNSFWNKLAAALWVETVAIRKKIRRLKTKLKKCKSIFR